MEALNFLKFWRPTTTNTCYTAPICPNPLVKREHGVDEEEEEDSFFDLELAVSDFDNKKIKSDNDPETNDEKDNKSRLDSKKAGHGHHKLSEPTLSQSPNDPISKRKILPIEPSSKPQSPIALLKSAPRFQVSMFKKPKSSKSMSTQKTEKTEKAESKTVFVDTQKQRRQDSKASTVRFKGEEAPNHSLFTRANSWRKAETKPYDHQGSEDPKTERFSKDVIQKYLNLIKPLYVKVSKRYSEKIRFSGELSMASPSSSPATTVLPKKEKQGNIPAGIREVCKHLGKSKSASAAIGVAPVVNRRDDSLWEQHDGIQSAILHCKRSFNSRDCSSLSRSNSDSLHGKSRIYFSRDSSLLSQFTNEHSDQNFLGNCIEEGDEIGISAGKCSP